MACKSLFNQKKITESQLIIAALKWKLFGEVLYCESGSDHYKIVLHAIKLDYISSLLTKDSDQIKEAVDHIMVTKS